TPLPTVMPDAALQTAREYLHNGDYAHAVATFQSVLVQPPESYPADVRAASAYGLGEAALREGLFDQALTALTEFLAQFPADARVPWAYFLRGDALLGLGQWQAAIQDFQQYLNLRAGVIDSYVYERIGDAYYAQALFPEAVGYYEQAVAAGRSLVPLLALRERVAQRYLNIAQPVEAVTQYDAILAVAQNAGYRAEIMYLVAQALQASGDDAGAFARYQQLMAAYPDSGYAYQALQLLLAAGQTIDAETRGRVSFAAEDYSAAIEAFHEYTGQLALSEVPLDIHLLLGQAYRALGNTPAAQTSFQTIIEQFPTSPQYGPALLEQGRTLYWAGNTPAAIEYYLAIATDHADLPEAAEALWRAGYLYEQLGMTSESVATFERLGRTYPGNEWAQEGLLRAAMAASARNDLVTAERLFAALGATGTGQEVAAAYLWLGRMAQRNGNAVQATSAFNAAAAADPGGYYSIRAEDQLIGRGIFERPVGYRYEFDDQAEVQQAEAWLRTTFGITQAGTLWSLAPELQADPRLVAGLELWALLSFDEASEEFYGLLDDHEDDALGSYQLAIYFRGIGAYPQSIVGAANVLEAANVPTIQAPAYLARMRYPVFYRDLVVPAAEARGVDPLLVFTLIRQESLFDRYATAAAGEKGLTQVIPGTGDYIATQLNWPDYQHTDLFSPYASIVFGVYYLWEQLDRFDFNVVAGFAGYNAGPGNALSWLEASGGDPDLFVEAITIDSTRRYVQLMYEHYHVYRYLYGVNP
ncbi:MAG: tetratricopeptide repeat protein, partial [Anaerolineae bacterium]|nr:tetratricopeptide repeat protein [Anaerolineae bacterium]